MPTPLSRSGLFFTNMALDLSELEAELNRTRRKVQDWAASRVQLAAERKDQHFALMQDQTGAMRETQQTTLHYVCCLARRLGS